MTSKFQVTFDCEKPLPLSEFWAETLGYMLQPPPEGFESWEQFADANNIPEERRDSISAIVDPAGGPRVLFLRVPERKTVKNRVHLDVNVGDSDMDESQRRAKVDSEVERLISLGATRIRPMEEHGGYWVVMTDPEGNEFCVQ